MISEIDVTTRCGCYRLGTLVVDRPKYRTFNGRSNPRVTGIVDGICGGSMSVFWCDGSRTVVNGAFSDRLEVREY